MPVLRPCSDACTSAPAGDQQGAGHCSFQYASPSAFTLPWTNGITSGAAMNAPQAGTLACTADFHAARLSRSLHAVQQLAAVRPLPCIQGHRQGLRPKPHTDHIRALHSHHRRVRSAQHTTQIAGGPGPQELFAGAQNARQEPSTWPLLGTGAGLVCGIPCNARQVAARGWTAQFQQACLPLTELACCAGSTPFTFSFQGSNAWCCWRARACLLPGQRQATDSCCCKVHQTRHREHEARVFLLLPSAQKTI